MTACEQLRLEGERRYVLRQLRFRFGSLSADAEARVVSAHEQLLELWAERILTATQLEEVWSTPLT